MSSGSTRSSRRLPQSPLRWITAVHLVITVLGRAHTNTEQSGKIQQGASSLQDSHSQEEQVESKDASDNFLKRLIYLMCIPECPDTYTISLQELRETRRCQYF